MDSWSYLFVIVIFLVYGWIGYRQEKHFVVWGLIGLGILITPSLIFFMFLDLFQNPDDALMFWMLVAVNSFLLALGIALWLILRRRLFSSHPRINRDN